MNQLDVNVIVSGTAPNDLAFAYQAADPSQPTAKYLDPKSGDITVPKGVTNLRIAFHLKPRLLDASFDLGQSAGKKALTIWSVEPGKSTKMTPDPPDFGPVGVSTSSPPMSVSVIDRNQLPGPVDYEYQLVVGVRVNGVIHPVSTPDPKIRNGSDRIAVSPWIVAGITVLVLAGLFALYVWNRNRSASDPGGEMGGTPTTSMPVGATEPGSLRDREDGGLRNTIQVKINYQKNDDQEKEFTYSRTDAGDSPVELDLRGNITVPPQSGPVAITFHIHEASRGLAFAQVPFGIYTSASGGKGEKPGEEFLGPFPGEDWPKSFTIIDRNTLPSCSDPCAYAVYFYKLNFTRDGQPDLSTPDPKIRNGGATLTSP